MSRARGVLLGAFAKLRKATVSLHSAIYHNDMESNRMVLFFIRSSFLEMDPPPGASVADCFGKGNFLTEVSKACRVVFRCIEASWHVINIRIMWVAWYS